MKQIFTLRAIIVFLVSSFLISCIFKSNFTTQSSSTALPTSSLTTENIQIPTLTYIPTLSKQDALETLVNLIESNEDCNLPCWLDIVPGEVKFNTAISIFLQFSTIAYIEFTSEQADLRVFFPDFEIAIHDTTTRVYSIDNENISHIWVYAGVDPKGNYDNVSYNYSEYQNLWKRYLVSEIFKTHGTPEKIFLDTTLIAVDNAVSYPFVLWVVYPQNGFLIRYEGINEKIGDAVRICPIKSRIEIKIWDVKMFTYEDFMKNDSAMNSISLGPQPIESVTDFTIESFYNFFKDGNTDTCFDTPSSYWPPN